MLVCTRVPLRSTVGTGSLGPYSIQIVRRNDRFFSEPADLSIYMSQIRNDPCRGGALPFFFSRCAHDILCKIDVGYLQGPSARRGRLAEIATCG